MERISLLEQLAVPCAHGPHLPAIINARHGVLSRTQLSRRVRAIADGFTAAGLRPGERVLFAVRPDAEAVLLMLGISAAGGVLVPLDSNMGPALFASRMELLSPQWVVAESALLALSASRWILRLLGWCGINLPPVAAMTNAQFVSVGPLWPGTRSKLTAAAIEKLGQQADNPVRAPVDRDDAAMIVFTSGTAGAPKAVVHSWRSTQAVFDAVGSLLDAGANDVIHARELHLIIPALIAGATIFIPARHKFSAARTLQDLKRCRVTHLFSVAAECRQLLDHLRSNELHLPASLREIWIGAAPVHASFLKEFQAVLSRGTNVWCVYGMTEILPVARVSLAQKLAYPGDGDLVGECVAGVNARVSTDGELLLSGPNLFARYFGEPVCMEHATGDLARLVDGSIALLGRRKDMIIRGRFNIYPELYETVIERIDGVKRCAMIGIHDMGPADERVVLVVEPRAVGAGEVLKKRLWRELRNGPYSIDAAALPDVIMIMALPTIGRSSKVDKGRLREIVHRGMACESL